jgi:hypothetical protein
MHHLAAHNTIKNKAMKTMSRKNKHHKGNTKLNVIKKEDNSWLHKQRKRCNGRSQVLNNYHA